MRKIFAAVALAISVPLAACNGGTGIDLTKPVLAESTKDEKALYVAEASFQGASLALEQAIDNGLITPTNAGQAQAYYRGAYNALLAMREAQKTGDSGTILEMSVLVQRYAAQVFSLLG
jgi:hypothetical protein